MRWDEPARIRREFARIRTTASSTTTNQPPRGRCFCAHFPRVPAFRVPSACLPLPRPRPFCQPFLQCLENPSRGFSKPWKPFSAFFQGLEACFADFSQPWKQVFGVIPLRGRRGVRRGRGRFRRWRCASRRGLGSRGGGRGGRSPSGGPPSGSGPSVRASP